jgi:microcystin-dependent protein
MRKFFNMLFLLVGITSANAGVPCALPFNLQNGTPADATQVMANYNAIISCLGNAAAAGVNSDITQLTGLVAPLSPANGGTQTFVATAPSTGAGNTQVIASTTPTGFLLTFGYNVIFVAGATNTGATTLQVGGAIATPVFRRTTDGALPLAGGEIISGTVTAATYDGAHFQLLGVAVPIGTVQMTLAPVADPGFVLMQGQCLATAGSFNSLWTKLGSPSPGACPAGNFALPDGRGRVGAMVDSGGSGRITAAGGNFDGTVIGNSGGAQNHALTVAELAAHTHTVTDPGHTHTFSIASSTVVTLAGTGANLQGGGGALGTNAVSGTTGSSLTGITGTNSTGTGTAHSILQPTLMVNMQIKF